MDIDAILRELAGIRDELDGPVDGARYVELTARRDELRRAARLATPSTPQMLRAELERLLATWDRLAGRRIDVVQQAGDLAAGNFGFTTDAVALNRRIDSAGGRADLEARIRDLRARLAAAEGESG